MARQIPACVFLLLAASCGYYVWISNGASTPQNWAAFMGCILFSAIGVNLFVPANKD